MNNMIHIVAALACHAMRTGGDLCRFVYYGFLYNYHNEGMHLEFNCN